MSLSSPAPWFAICALCLLIGAVVARRSSFFRDHLAEVGASRFEAVDGLRGFLALGVFGAHAVNMYSLHTSGSWPAAGAPFYMLAAKAGVALFFMITGFLFWLRVLRAGASLDYRAFFVGRLRRLAPMYAMSVLMVLAIVAAASGFTLRESPGALLRELRPWLSFGFMQVGELNGVRDAHYINAVYWTLAYEWMFYVALPFLAVFARGPGSVLLAGAVLAFGTQTPIVFNFLCGAFAAVLVHGKVLEGRLASRWLAVVPLGALAGYFALPGIAMAAVIRGLMEAALLFGFFVFVVHGWSVFGLLRSRPAKLLGTISYSIYLTHCIVLFVTVRAVGGLVPVGSLDGLQYWLLAAFAAAACVLLSACTYRYVEYPFLLDSRGASRQPAPSVRLQVAS